MDFDASRPIWHQLVEEFSRRIAVGTWTAGHRIPGVRDLAAELGVNPNTVQRALAELEREGLCRSERAVGRFVTEDAERIAALRRSLATEGADAYVTYARGLALTLADATELLARRWQAPATNTSAAGQKHAEPTYPDHPDNTHPRPPGVPS